MAANIQDVRLSMTEEEKDNELEMLKKEMRLMRENMKILMQSKSSENEENREREAMKRWFSNTVKLPQYFQLFIENGFESFDIIREIEIDELTQIGVDKLGHRKKIIKEISALDIDSKIALANEGATVYI